MKSVLTPQEPGHIKRTSSGRRRTVDAAGATDYKGGSVPQMTDTSNAWFQGQGILRVAFCGGSEDL